MIRKIFGLIVVIGGIALILISVYIKQQVAAGNLQIESAQKKVDTSSGLFSLNPVSKEVGKGLTGGAQKQINAGKEDVAYYTQLAGQLQIGGIVLIIVGAVIFLIPRRKKK